jgi:imidazolonepropionase
VTATLAPKRETHPNKFTRLELASDSQRVTLKVMSDPVDLLIHNTSQICTLPTQDGGPQRGPALGTLGLVEEGAIALRDGLIVAVGSDAALREQYQAVQEIDAEGCAIVPGFVDPHTHLVWAGDRAAEFEMRLAGASYMEIMAAGGGINSTVSLTRAASIEQLVAETLPRLERMLRAGTTTVEIKTGYGLDIPNEIKLLDAINQLAAQCPMDIVPTFLGAHAIPPEYKDDTGAYVDLLVERMIPEVAEHARKDGQPMPFIDAFCEEGVFDLEQTRRILEAGQACGMLLKLHADEFKALGGTGLAVELGAVSVDHLVATPRKDIEALGKGQTVAVALPATPFGLGHLEYTPAAAIREAGGALALATDCNPGTAWCESMQFVMALACRAMRLTPAEALAAATINAAFALGRGERVGSLEPGKQADLLILDVPDWRHLAYRFGGNLVRTVLKRGNIVWTSSTV